MTVHRSLRGVNTLVGERSVLTRFERIRKLAHDGRLDSETDSAYGLPKVRTKFKVVSAKKAAAREEALKGSGGDDASEGEAEAESAS